MGSVVTAVCTLIAILVMAYTAFRILAMSLAHAHKMRVLRYDHDHLMAQLRHEQTLAEAQSEANRQPPAVRIRITDVPPDVFAKIRGELEGYAPEEIR